MKRLNGRGTSPWPWGALGALLLIGVVEFEILLHQEYFAFVDRPVLNYKSELAQLSSNHYQVVVIGDSLALGAIDPLIIKAQTGLATVNLAGFGKDTLLTHWCWLKKYLDHAAKNPRFIVASWLPGTFSQSEMYPTRRYEIDRSCIKDFAKTHGYLQGVVSILPSLRARYQLNHLLTEWERLLPLNLDTNQVHRELDAHHGYFNYRPDGVWVPSAEPQSKARFPDYSPSRLSHLYLEKIAELAQSANATLLLVHPRIPGRPELRYLKDLEQFAATHSNVKVIHPPEDLANPKYSYDGWHLNRAGALILSDVVSKEIVSLFSDTAGGE